MALTDFISLLRQGSMQGSKSTVVSPIAWAIGVVLAGVLIGARTAIPNWVLVVLIVSFVVLVLTFVAAYGYFAVKNPDMLRKERFNLKKMAIEHHLRGDDLTGITEEIELIGAAPPVKAAALPAPGRKQGERSAVEQDASREDRAT